MALSIYNTLSGQKEEFVPLEPGRVSIYVCGPTVYDLAHLGHARSAVAFDTVVRYLRRHYQVRYVRNFTDVDDKIIKRAQERGESPAALSAHFINEFQQDMAALGVLPPDVEPRVTQHMGEIVALIEQLVAKEMAYASGGDVYYAVERFATYGKLGRRKLADMEAGARVEVGEHKRHPMDFALWKAAKEGEPAWPSPWGAGRPGWHIECSAMSGKYLGATFDIHGGGKDLIFPHHENEIAQSEAAHGVSLARFWMHNGFVNIDDEKMSKSLGNFFTVRQLLQTFDAQALRLFLLTTHYRSPINFADSLLREAEQRVQYCYETLEKMDAFLALPHAGETAEAAAALPYREPWVAEMPACFAQAMDDDFNTAKAVGDLSRAFSLANDILARGASDTAGAAMERRTLRALRQGIGEAGAVLGLFCEQPAAVLARMAQRRAQARQLDAAHVQRLVDARLQARRARDFAAADALRAELSALGVVLKDTATGTEWKVG